MIKSMTGYGRGESDNCEENCVAEIKSVNHRHIEISIKTPFKDSTLDAFLRKKIKEVFKRGYFELFLKPLDSGQKAETLCFNDEILKGYFDLSNRAKKEFGLQGTLDVNTLLGLPGVICQEKRELDASSFQDAVNFSLEKAILALDQMRQKEGSVLQQDLSDRLNFIQSEIGIIKEKYPLLLSKFQERYRKRLREATEDVGIDDERLAQEVVILLDKGDISEEITRLESHLIRFRETFDLAPPVGKRLDFILQEMSREANTIGSKGVDSIITDSVVSIKCEIEKMREQTQNVE